MSAFGSLSTVATEIGSHSGIDVYKLAFSRVPVFSKEITLAGSHACCQRCSIFVQFNLSRTLNIEPNKVHDSFTLLYQIPLICESFLNVLGNMPAAVLELIAGQGDRHRRNQ